MHGEVPQFTRCCFCIPLRRGLIGWGYIRAGLDVIFILHLIYTFAWFCSLGGGWGHLDYFLLMMVIVIIDCVFCMLLIVSGHMKSAKLLRVSYICGIVWLSIVFSLGALFAVVDAYMMITLAVKGNFRIKRLIVELVLTVSLLLSLVSIQVYVVLLTRSEMIKLQNQSLEMQFTNHGADGEARCVRAEKLDGRAGLHSTAVVDV